jgi:magnesium chelatase family protein
MGVKELRGHCRLPDGASGLLETAMNKLGFSARSLDKNLKIARTIADLEGSPELTKPHIIEAMQYRALDKTTELVAKS